MLRPACRIFGPSSILGRPLPAPSLNPSLLCRPNNTLVFPPVTPSPLELPTNPHELGKFIRKGYTPVVREPPLQIPATSSWQQEHLDLFHLHYFNLRTEWVERLLCPLSSTIAPDAQEIIASNMGIDAFLEGLHTEGHHPFLTLFGNRIAEIKSLGSTEAAVDALSGVVMEACNRHQKEFVTLAKQAIIHVKTGDFTFRSIPDTVTTIRRMLLKTLPVSVIVVEDKRKQGGDAKFQLPGDMLATAFRNKFECHIPGDQTIFAVRFKDTQISFYRAEFSTSYLNSVRLGFPTTPVTIFKFGGGFDNTKTGLRLADAGSERTLAFQVLTSVYDFLYREVYPHWHKEPSQQSPVATQRLREIDQQ